MLFVDNMGEEKVQQSYFAFPHFLYFYVILYLLNVGMLEFHLINVIRSPFEFYGWIHGLIGHADEKENRKDV